MVRDIFKCLGIAVLSLVLAFGIVLGTYYATKDVYADNYQKGFVYQYRRLQSADDGTPKVVVFGGSYLAFSLNTKQMQEELGVPCYELGVQSNMGMCYTIELLEDQINEGDIVVFPFEDFARDDYGMDLITLTLDGQLDMTLDFLKRHPLELIEAVPRATTRRVLGQFRAANSAPETVYVASAFDQEYAYYNLDRPEPTVSEESLINAGYAYYIGDIDPSCLEVLNEFNALCEEKGATLLITYMPMCTQSVFTDEEGRQAYMEYLDENLDPEIICSLEDCFYDYEYVFNGFSHLNSKGQEKYTSDLSEMLKPYVNEVE